MAKITFEAGDVISFTETPNNDESIRNKYLGVCLDSRRYISLFLESCSDDCEDALFLDEDEIKDIPKSALPVNIDDVELAGHVYRMFSALTLMAKTNCESNRGAKTSGEEFVNVVHESVWLALLQLSIELEDLGRDGQDMRDSGMIKQGDFVKIAPKSTNEIATLYFVDAHGWRLINRS